VLTSLLYLAIPEEVAQYAERARIMSYYPLGQAAARTGEAKTIWLWTTLANRDAGHHFDNLRLFAWNTRRQRYETAYIERNLKGWLPLKLVKNGGAVTGWRALLENRNGELQWVTYSWDGSRVRVVSREPGALPEPWYVAPGATPEGEDIEAPAPSVSLRERAAAFLRALRERFSR
jgi:hypothetical protein